MDQGTEKWLLTSRWMLWLAPAGLRGSLKLEAYHQRRQPQSFFLCRPQCSGTSDRCSGRCGVIFLRAVAAAVSSSTSLRRLRLRVAAQASGTSLLMFPLFPTLRRPVSHAGERLRHQRLLHAGERLRYQRLSDHQSTQDEVRSRIFGGSRAERFSRSHASSMIPVGSKRRDSCGRGSRRL